MNFLTDWIKATKSTAKSQQDKWWWVGLGVAIVLCFVAALSNNRSEAPVQQSPEDVTTYIPAGYVLVPITLVNFESLDSILGQTGVVDLFAVDPERQNQSRLIVRQIKIMRAPLNPSHFAVLAPESKAPEIVRHSASYFAVLQNSKRAGMRFEQRPKGRSRLSIEEL